LQNLCMAFFHIMSKAQEQQVTTINTQVNQSFNVKVEAPDEELRLAQAKERAARMEVLAMHLYTELGKSRSRVEEIEHMLCETRTELIVFEQRARCAPPFFDDVAAFLRARCSIGEEERAGSAELHAAFGAYLREVGRVGESPSQRDLRSLLEKLGFCYDQIYIKGTNARGFRGLGLINLGEGTVAIRP
jgi:hypothetical protein